MDDIGFTWELPKLGKKKLKEEEELGESIESLMKTSRSPGFNADLVFLFNLFLPFLFLVVFKSTCIDINDLYWIL